MGGLCAQLTYSPLMVCRSPTVHTFETDCVNPVGSFKRSSGNGGQLCMAVHTFAARKPVLDGAGVRTMRTV